MDIYEAIENRRTIRKFEKAATKEQLNRIITAATLSPSSQNLQNWEFVIVDDPALIEQVSEIKYLLNRGKPREEEVPPEKDAAAQRQKDSFANAGLVVVFHDSKQADSAGPWCSIENMLLAAVAEGLGTRIARFGGDAAAAVKELMHAPEGMELVAAISVGVPAEVPGPRNLRPEGSWLHRNRF
jgi:nitroreductase